jgi:hypothetical protein
LIVVGVLLLAAPGTAQAAHALVATTAADMVLTRFDVRASAGITYHWDRTF